MVGLILRALYTVAWYVLLPVVLSRLMWRGRKQPGYRAHIGERFGFYARAAAGPYIWVHAVSVGEMRAAQPVLKTLQARYPGHRLLLTCMTPTGRDTAGELYGDTAEIVYLPYDLPLAARRFLRHFEPALALFMETELWPNLLAATARAKIPALLINARLSERSARGYRRIHRLIGPALRSLTAIAAQSQADARRLAELGGRAIEVCGNIKFDIVPPAAQLERGDALRQRFGPGRRIVLTASTREGEEERLLAARPNPWPADLLWIIVPRHPQRFDEVAALVEEAGLRLKRRSENGAVEAATQVCLGDSMGEMFAYYAACDLAFIGGSLLPYGAQNLIEAAAVGKPILIGPYTFNFAEATRLALECGAAENVSDAETFWNKALALLDHPLDLERRGQAGLAFSAQHRGATERVMALIERNWSGR